MSTVLNAVLLPAYHAVTTLVAILGPLLGAAAPAGAVIVFTALVRLVLHPLARAQYRAQQRAEQARRALAPAVAKIRRRHRDDPARVLRETADLYRRNGVSPSAGILPGLAQAPVVFVMYRLFVSTAVGGRINTLLTDTLASVPLGARLRDATQQPGQSAAAHYAVFATLLLAAATIAHWTVRRNRAQAATAIAAAAATAAAPQPPAAPQPRLVAALPYLPYLTILTIAVVPLATGLYLVTSTLWTVLERRHLTRRNPAPPTTPSPGRQPAAAAG